MTCFTAPLPTNANPNMHRMLHSVGANRGQLLYVYFTGGAVAEGGGAAAIRSERRQLTSLPAYMRRSNAQGSSKTRRKVTLLVICRITFWISCAMSQVFVAARRGCTVQPRRRAAAMWSRETMIRPSRRSFRTWSSRSRTAWPSSPSWTSLARWNFSSTRATMWVGGVHSLQLPALPTTTTTINSCL